MKKVGIIGITGKVGSLVSKLVSEDSELELIGGTSSNSSTSDFEKLAENSDVLIDFSLPESTMHAIKAAELHNIAFVCGTTGISEAEFSKIKNAAKQIPVFYTSNFSIAIHLMASMLKKCSETLREYDISIIDKHHKNKKDSPSGTSIFLSKQVGCKAQILSIRSGNIPAEMICDFCGDDDMLTISHRAFGRGVFAKGAVACAKWILGKAAKMYSMQDYLDAKN